MLSFEMVDNNVMSDTPATVFFLNPSCQSAFLNALDFFELTDVPPPPATGSAVEAPPAFLPAFLEMACGKKKKAIERTRRLAISKTLCVVVFLEWIASPSFVKKKKVLPFVIVYYYQVRDFPETETVLVIPLLPDSQSSRIPF